MTGVEMAAERLGRPGLEPVVDELARRLSEGGGAPVRIRLRSLQPDERAAIADLLGTPRLPPVDWSLAAERLASALELPGRETLREVVEVLRGPLRDRRAERAAERRARDKLWEWFEGRADRLSISGLGPVSRWPDDVRRDGVRASVGEHRALLTKALDLLDRLATVPETGTPLAVLANEALGDPHALDPGRPVARLVTAAIADAARHQRPATAEELRATWELVRVIPDPLSSNVLVLGLDGGADHALAPVLHLHRGVSEPLVFTLSQLQRWPIEALPPDEAGFVVENPAVVATAAACGWDGPPIVCSSGRPSIAVVTILRQLGARGAPLHQHADFDAAGVGITAWLAEHAGTTPWRMTSEDYLAVATARHDRPRLRGAVPATPWDPSLGQAMADQGAVVFEEELADSLLGAMSSS
ncbi:MAG TPA: TIGR02679 family protein [Acidimicrobiia bacterium]